MKKTKRIQTFSILFCKIANKQKKNIRKGLLGPSTIYHRQAPDVRCVNCGIQRNEKKYSLCFKMKFPFLRRKVCMYDD